MQFICQDVRSNYPQQMEEHRIEALNEVGNETTIGQS